MPDEVYKIFKDEYLNKCAPVDIPEAHYVQKQNGTICAAITASANGEQTIIQQRATDVLTLWQMLSSRL